MFLIVHVPSRAREQGLCDIDSLKSRKIQKNIGGIYRK